MIEGIAGVAYVILVMNKLSQTDSAIFISFMYILFRKNLSFQNFLAMNQAATRSALSFCREYDEKTVQYFLQWSLNSARTVKFILTLIVLKSLHAFGVSFRWN